MSEPTFMEVDDLLGAGSEEAIYKAGFQQGLDEGTQEGAGEGWAVGLRTGASIGFELGRYKGFALAAKESLRQKSPPPITVPVGETSSKTEDNLLGGATTTAEEAAASPSSSSQGKSTRLCERIIKAVDEFDFENISSVHDACSQVRSQFNLLKSSLGVTGGEAVDKQSISGQKYSF